MATVLFVDDEVRVTRSIARALSSLPFTVITANSANEGLELLRVTDVDVVVSDERMPDMSGSEFLTIAYSEFPDVERIILTGEAAVGAMISAINDARVFRFLTKPCSIDEIVSCLHEALNARHERFAERDSHQKFDAASDWHVTEALAGARLVYQPIFSAHDRGVYAYEALLRSNLSALPTPVAVIQAAVGLQRGFDLDRTVRRLVAADLEAEDHGQSIFVNLLPESLGDPELLSATDPLRPYADRVVFEITERTSLDTIDDIEAKVAALRACGYGIALDDLGAGFAGLTAFAALQPDVVKFDLELVRNVERSPTRAKLIESMVRLCRDLGTLTVAEGVETPDEFDFLIGLGCDLYQGYFIGKPAAPFARVDPSLAARVDECLPAALSAVEPASDHRCCDRSELRPEISD